jgi:hypothetical protein
MNIVSLLVFILIIVLVMIIAGLVMKLVRPIIFLAFIFLILFIFTSGTIVKDFFDIRDKVGTNTNIALMEKDDDIIAGFVESEEFNLFDTEELAELDILYDNGELGEIRGGHYKLFILDAKKFRDIDGMEINNKMVTGELLYHFFANDEPIASITYDDLLVDPGIEERSDMKSALFAYLYKNDLKLSKSPIFFFESYKEGSLIVYPETMFFKFTKVIPLKWIYEKLDNLKSRIEDKANTAIKEAMT